MIRLGLGGQPQMETQSSDQVNCLLLILTLCLVTHICNLTKFSRFHKVRAISDPLERLVNQVEIRHQPSYLAN